MINSLWYFQHLLPNKYLMNNGLSDMGLFSQFPTLKFFSPAKGNHSVLQECSCCALCQNFQVNRQQQCGILQTFRLLQCSPRGTYGSSWNLTSLKSVPQTTFFLPNNTENHIQQPTDVCYLKSLLPEAYRNRDKYKLPHSRKKTNQRFMEYIFPILHRNQEAFLLAQG